MITNRNKCQCKGNRTRCYKQLPADSGTEGIILKKFMSAKVANGATIIKAIITNFKKSVNSSSTMLLTVAPSTLRTPISFVR